MTVCSEVAGQSVPSSYLLLGSVRLERNLVGGKKKTGEDSLERSQVQAKHQKPWFQ